MNNDINNNLFETPIGSNNQTTAIPVVNEPTAPVENNVQTPEVVNNVPTPVTPAPVAPETPAAPVEVAPVSVTPAPVEPLVAPPQASPTEVTVVDTSKKKSSNVLLFLVIAVIALFIVKIDDVIDFFDKNIVQTNPSSVNETDTYNLIDGFIKVDQNNSYIKLKKIKFYNFKKNSDTDKSILYSVESEKVYSSVDDLNIYIELYSSDKELIYKDKFVPDSSLEKNTVRTLTLNISDNVYNNVFYALVKVGTTDNSSSTLTCTLNDTKDDYNLVKKNVYSFKNDELIGYEINQELTIINETKEALTLQTLINNEFNNLSNFSLTGTLENNKLNYSISLDNVPTGYIVLYDNKATSELIKKLETIKKWNCE